MFVRVKDPATGHEFDVDERSPLLSDELVRRVKGDRYPPSERPRAPKHHIDLPAAPAGGQPKSHGEGVANTEEIHHG